MNNRNALQKLLNGTASEEEISLLKQGLANRQVSIGGNVNQAVIILGDGNMVNLTPQALDRLGGGSLLDDLNRDLTGDEIATGLNRIEAELQLRAPILLAQFQEQTRRLRPTLKTNPNALSESLRKERLEALAHINSLCMEALDISFNAVATGELPPEYEVRCPFRGLESFRVEDREFFLGREELTQKLVRKIQAHSFLAVLGASGSGKSSLVMAGMIPALDLDYAIIRPGTNPLEALDSARSKSLLVVDQFEELFTLTRDEKTRADFIFVLLDFAESCKVIITLRSDFLGEAGAYRSLSEEIQNHLEIIPPMNADELRRAMEGQARWARLVFEADLSQQILDDVVGEPGAMPLLQHALWELWNRRHGRHLRAEEYHAFGGVKQAITSTAEKVYGECSKSEQEQARDIFLRLTRLDEGNEGRDTRRRVPLGDLIPSGTDAASVSTLLDKLTNARLIVKTVQEDMTEIEVAHEALIHHWERLRIWLNEDRDHLRLRESVSESAKEWEQADKEETLLNHRGGRLDDSLLLGSSTRYSLNVLEQEYLQQCVALLRREKLAREQHLQKEQELEKYKMEEQFKHLNEQVKRQQRNRLSFLVGIGLFYFLNLFVTSYLGRPAGVFTYAAPNGMVSLELAGRAEIVSAIFDSWGSHTRLYVAFSLGLSFFFSVLFSFSLWYGCKWVSEWIGAKSQVGFRIGDWIAWGQIAAGILSAIGNTVILLMLFNTPQDPLPQIAFWSFILMFWLILAGLAYIVTAIFRGTLIKPKATSNL